jgi:hypothetical protein
MSAAFHVKEASKFLADAVASTNSQNIGMPRNAKVRTAAAALEAVKNVSNDDGNVVIRC